MTPTLDHWMSAMARRRTLVTAIGASSVATSSLFIDLSGASPGTASFFRCALAVPLLVPLAWSERRGNGALEARQWVWAAVGGALFAADSLLWTRAIHEVGVGLSAVLVNTQVVMVPLLAAVVDHERPTRRFARLLPIVVVGTVLAGGILQTGVTGASAPLGTLHSVLAALCYSTFLFLLRREGSTGRPVQNYAAVMCIAAVCAWLGGLMWGGFSPEPGWSVIGWLALTAVFGHVLGWMLVALGTPGLRAEVASALLLLTPVVAMVLAAAFVSQVPTGLQALGCVLIVGAAYLITVAPSPRGA